MPPLIMTEISKPPNSFSLFCNLLGSVLQAAVAKKPFVNPTNTEFIITTAGDIQNLPESKAIKKLDATSTSLIKAPASINGLG